MKREDKQKKKKKVKGLEKKQYFNKINEKLDEELDGNRRWWQKEKIKYPSVRLALVQACRL